MILSLLQWPDPELTMSLRLVCKCYSAAIDLTNDSLVERDSAASGKTASRWICAQGHLSQQLYMWINGGADLGIPIASFPDSFSSTTSWWCWVRGGTGWQCWTLPEPWWFQKTVKVNPLSFCSPKSPTLSFCVLGNSLLQRTALPHDLDKTSCPLVFVTPQELRVTT